MLSPMTPLLLAGLLACRQLPDKDADTGSDSPTDDTPFEAQQPWLGWQAVALEGLHPLLDVSLPDAIAPAAIETIIGRRQKHQLQGCVHVREVVL